MKSGKTFASVGYLLGRRSRRTAGTLLMVFSGSLFLLLMFLLSCLPRRRRRIAHCLRRSKSRYRHGNCECECKEQCSQLFHGCISFQLVFTQLLSHLKGRINIRLGTSFNCNRRGLAMTAGSLRPRRNSCRLYTVIEKFFSSIASGGLPATAG